MSNTTQTPTESRLPILLTVDEAAAVLRVHPETLRRLRRDGTIQGVTINAAIRFSTDEIARIAVKGCGHTMQHKPKADAAVVEVRRLTQLGNIR